MRSAGALMASAMSTPRASVSPRTSQSSPLRVALLPTASSGQVGLTIAPGKRGPSMSGPPWARDLPTDLDRLIEVFGTEVLVCLLQDEELQRLQIPDLVCQAQRRGLVVHRLPIPDGGVLPSVEPVRQLVEVISQACTAGQNVTIHCAGGVGRAGTVAGCFLVHQGATAPEAIATLHERRSQRCPENSAQERFIEAYAQDRRARWANSSRGRSASIESRVAGAVLGAAVGDAMGHPTEFMDLEEIHAEYGPSGVQEYELFWEQDGLRYAPYTDDTQMAEAVAEGLLEVSAPDAELDAAMQAIARRFIKWASAPQGGHRAPGNACLRGSTALAQGAHWSQAGGRTAGGCGSVMRAYSFGLLLHADLERAEAWSVAHSKLTHRDPIALAACAAMAVGIARVIRQEDLHHVVLEMIAAAQRYSPRTADMMSRAFDEARAGVAPEVTLERLQGWAAHEAIAAAVYIFVRHPDDPRAAILEGANTPGDSDSLATLAGALCGARCGLDALPTDWVRQVERSGQLLSLATRIAEACNRG